MFKRSNQPGATIRPLFALIVLLFVSAIATAQNRRAPNAADRLARYLDLTEEQATQVREVVGEEWSPGILWTVAARLQTILSDDQKSKLLSLPEASDFMGRRGAFRGGRGRGMGPGWSGENPPPALEERDTAREEALELSDSQKQKLESWSTQAARRRPVGGLPAEVAETLTDEQSEIAELHDALALALRPSLGRGGRGMGPGRGYGPRFEGGRQGRGFGPGGGRGFGPRWRFRR